SALVRPIPPAAPVTSATRPVRSNASRTLWAVSTGAPYAPPASRPFRPARSSGSGGDALDRQELALHLEPAAVAADAVARHDPVARHDHGDRVASIRLS